MNVASASIEASSLGWKAGEWPTNFLYHGVTYWRGMKMLLNGQLAWYDYSTSTGVHLTVFND